MFDVLIKNSQELQLWSVILYDVLTFDTYN